MISCVADIENPHLFSAWATFCHIPVSQLLCVLIDRSSIPVSIYDSGVLVARSSTYKGV